MTYTQLEAGKRITVDQNTARGDATETQGVASMVLRGGASEGKRGGLMEGIAEVVQREIRLPVGVMSQPLCDAPQKKANRTIPEIVGGVKAARGRSPEQLAMAGKALEMLKAKRQERVSTVRTGLALGQYESEAKIAFVVERILEDVDNGVL